MPAESSTVPSQPTAPAWSGRELDNPHASEDKATKVRDMFSAIARSYDLNNRVHSLGMDQLWRRAAVKAADVRPGDEVLDVACGTGDLSMAFAQTQAARVVGADFTPRMLDFARTKQPAMKPEHAGKITYEQADAMDLPYDDASFDVVSIAFGIRNVQRPADAFAEFARVLRPGGRLVVLEFDQPRFPPVRWFNDLYCARIMPITATLISGDKSGAYRYLPRSVASFMTREQMLAAIGDTGLQNPTAKSLSLGICCCYRAIKPNA